MTYSTKSGKEIEKCLTLYVDDDKFASGAFRDAFKATPEISASVKKNGW